MSDPELLDKYAAIIRASFDAAEGEAVTEEHDAAVLASLLKSADRLAKQLEHSIIDAEWTRGEALDIVQGWLAGDELRAADLYESLGQIYGKERAMLIARTETAGVWNATNAAVLRAHGWSGVVWVAADDACDDCAELDGEVMTLTEYEESPIQHPNCSCTCVPADKEDAGDEVGEEEAA